MLVLPTPLPTLHGQRLRLRSYRPGDVDDLMALFSDPVVTRYWSSVAWTRLEQAEAYLSMRLAFRPPAAWAWAIADADSDRLLGTLTAMSLDGWPRRAEMGYALGPAHQGRGLAGEAVSLWLAHAFGEAGIARMEAEIHVGNLASQRLVERLGFRPEGERRRCWQAGGGSYDAWRYVLARP